MIKVRNCKTCGKEFHFSNPRKEKLYCSKECQRSVYRKYYRDKYNKKRGLRVHIVCASTREVEDDLNKWLKDFNILSSDIHSIHQSLTDNLTLITVFYKNKEKE